MISIRRFPFAGLLPVALVVLASVAKAEPAPLPIVSAVHVSPDTTFKPEGSYALNVAVEGQSMVMTFVVEKKADGSFAGVFRHAEMGEFATTSFKIEGRKLSMGIETPGGPANVVMTVQADGAVEGEWSMTGDGSRITGKKTS